MEPRRTIEQGYDEFEMLRGEVPTTNSRTREQRVASSLLRNRPDESSLTSAFDGLGIGDNIMPRIPQSQNADFSLHEGHKLYGDLYGLYGDRFSQLDNGNLYGRYSDKFSQLDNGNIYGRYSDKFSQLDSSNRRSLDSLSRNFGALLPNSPIPSNPQAYGNVNQMYGMMDLEYLQQLQRQQLELQLLHMGMQSSVGRSLPSSPYVDMATPNQGRDVNWDSYLNNNVVARTYNNMNPLLNSCGVNEYYPQHPSAELVSWFANRRKLQNQFDGRTGRQRVNNHLLPKYHALDSGINLNFDYITSQQSSHYENFPAFSDGRARHSPKHYDFRLFLKSLDAKYTSLDEVVGRIYELARDQSGCRFLQNFIHEGSPENIQKIFDEIIDHTLELLTDPSGNFFVVKLFKVCNEDQRMQTLNLITRREDKFFKISCHNLGSSPVQNIIECLQAEEQPLIASCLKHNILAMMKDINGFHVVHKCLQNFLPELTEFIFDVVITSCLDLATDRYGSCMVQKCIFLSNPEQKQLLMSQITSEAIFLSQDKFGNYAIQYVLDQEGPQARADVLNQFTGNYGDLLIQKYSSHVVEKCLKVAEKDELDKIIQELMNNHRLCEISLNEFGNYVIQCAYKVSKGAVKDAFVKAIKTHESVLACSPYGRSVLLAMGPQKSFSFKREGPMKFYKR